jgi:uncharacterized repeat protein (TIGR03803 family)
MQNQHRLFNILSCRFAFGALLSIAAMSCLAGVVITQNVSPGAANWPGSPLIATVTNPASQTSVGESFNAVGGCTNYCQTFTITTTNYTLQTISIYAGGGTGTGTGTNLMLRLFDLGTQTAPNPSPYVPGTDLFNSGNGLSITYAPQTVGVLQFDFTGSDQVTLQSGHLYAFEMDGVLNTSPLLWQRTTNDTYSGGAAYRNRSWINGNNAREFALAVYATVYTSTNTNTGTNTFWGPNGVMFHGFSAPSGGINQDGANPAAGLVLSGGVLLGTTLNGGSQGAGTAFWMTLDGTNFSTFRTFTNAPDAGNPQGNLAVSGSSFLGTTLAGGNNGVGTVFLGSTNGVSIIRSFTIVSADEATNSGGASPSALLALSGSTLYGTTTAGGAGANGTVFSMSTNGSSFSVLHDFTALDSNTGTNTDGALPCGGLILSGSTLYGTASAGGAGGAGVVFSVNTSGGSFTTLYSFTALDPVAATNTDGAFPSSGLVLSNGMLYGITIAGGTGGKGVIYSVGANGLGFGVLHNFSATDPLTGTNSDGASPCAPLVLSSNYLYGTASAGGARANGTVFSVSTNGGQFQTIHAFTAMNPSTGTNSDGAFPVAGLLPLGSSLYGTTFSGGPGGAGTVFNVAIPYPPAVITNIVRNLDGSVTLYFLGGPNSTNVIQATASLMPPSTWLNVSTNVADAGGAWQFIEPNTTNSTRFYRSYAP